MLLKHSRSSADCHRSRFDPIAVNSRDAYTRPAPGKEAKSWQSSCARHNASICWSNSRTAASVVCLCAASALTITTEALNQRFVKGMGKKKALVAVGHSILVIVYHVLQ